MPTATINAQQIVDTLARLRIARTVGDQREIRASERRLNFLLDQLPRPPQTAQE